MRYTILPGHPITGLEGQKYEESNKKLANCLKHVYLVMDYSCYLWLKATLMVNERYTGLIETDEGDVGASWSVDYLDWMQANGWQLPEWVFCRIELGSEVDAHDFAQKYLNKTQQYCRYDKESREFVDTIMPVAFIENSIQ